MPQQRCRSLLTRLKTFKLHAARSAAQRLYIRRLSEVHRATASAASMSPDCGRNLDALHAPRAVPAAISRAIAIPSPPPPPAVGPPHPVEQRLGHADAGHFVGHELGVSRALEREHAGDDRQPRVLDPLQERARTPATSNTGRVTTNSAPASTL